MTKPLMSFEEVKLLLKQRFPIIMIDAIMSLDPGKSIHAIKNVTGNEIFFLGHFPEYAVMPGSLIMEAMSQAASILFSKTTGAGIAPEEFLVLGMINEMRFFVPVVPGDKLDIQVDVTKIVKDIAFVESTATVDGVVVAKGKIGFGGKRLQAAPAAPKE
jgi:3-hydroxyacyl-[acyl-carrier-protein] dehydratase